MIRNLRVAIVNYIRNGRYRRDMLDKNMMFAHITKMIVICCNVSNFVMYAPALESYFT
jgi:hypothetical protein